MARVLLLSLIFSPDNVSTAQIMGGIAEDLAAAGHDVRVISTTPHYHRDLSLEAAQPLRRWFGRLIQKSDFHGIEAYHIWMPNKQCHPLLRILSWMNFHVASTLLSLFLRFRPDVVLAPSPPLLIGLNAWAIAGLHRAKYLYNVQELYPDIAVNLGVLRNKTVIGLLSRVERFIYRHAASVTTITEAMLRKIEQRVDRPGKARLIPNFVDFGFIHEAQPSNPFAEKYHLGGTFVITYAGNMGVPQNLEILVEAVRSLKGLEPSLRLLLIGDGGAKARLRELAEGADNIEIIDYQPISAMPDIYAASDLFYVGQSPDASSDGIPSKIYRIMGNRKPLLVVSAEGSDLARCVADVGSGVALATTDPTVLAAAIRQLMSDRAALAGMGEKGHRYASSTFERHQVTRQYVELVSSLAAEA
jgi:colanic acid biosynthesis glycosyl transferase WcaI